MRKRQPVHRVEERAMKLPAGQVSFVISQPPAGEVDGGIGKVESSIQSE